MTFTGSSLTGTFTFEHDVCVDCVDLVRTLPSGGYASWELNGSFMVLSSVETDPVMEMNITYADTSTAYEEVIVKGTPIAQGSLNDTYFPLLVSPTSQDMADYMWKTVTFQITLPTAYEAVMTDIEFDFTNGTIGSHMGTIVPKTESGSTSVAVEFSLENVQLYPTEGEMTITSYDSEGKAYTTIIMLGKLDGGFRRRSRGDYCRDTGYILQRCRLFRL